MSITITPTIDSFSMHVLTLCFAISPVRRDWLVFEGQIRIQNNGSFRRTQYASLGIYPFPGLTDPWNEISRMLHHTVLAALVPSACYAHDHFTKYGGPT